MASSPTRSTLDSLAVERAHPHGPRQWHRLRVEADLVVARLIVQATADFDRRLSSENRLAVARRIKRDVLNDAEGPIEHGNVFVERLKVVIARLRVVRV